MTYALVITIIMIVESIALFFIIFGRSAQKSEKEIKSELIIDNLLEKFNDNNEKINNIEVAKTEVRDAKINSRNDMVKLMDSWK